MIPTVLRSIVTVVLAATLPVLVAAGSLVAQDPAGGLGGQSLRPYTHVFIAYAIAWLVVLGWTWSIARRLGKVDRRLQR